MIRKWEGTGRIKSDEGELRLKEILPTVKFT
jgi:hypothetical protein